MIKIDTLRKIALSLPDTTEQPHFEKTSFRVGKKIFATLDVDNMIACLKLTVNEQDLFSLYDKSAIYPVPNKWGKQGWTYVNLKSIRQDMLTDALTAAYNGITEKNMLIKKRKQKK